MQNIYLYFSPKFQLCQTFFENGLAAIAVPVFGGRYSIVPLMEREFVILGSGMIGILVFS